MSEYQRDIDVDSCVNTPGEEAYEPLAFNPHSWSMDAGDFMLPESEEDMRIIGIAIRSMLDSDWWFDNCSQQYRSNAATSISYRKMRLADLILKACKANRLSAKMLEELGDE